MTETIRKFNIRQVLEGHPPRTNFNVIRLDHRYNVRIAQVTGRFPWHAHPNGDEGWLVWQGGLRIELEDGSSITLGPGDGTTIPRGTVHSPVCLEEGTIVVVFNLDGLDHSYREEAPDTGGFSERPWK